MLVLALDTATPAVTAGVVRVAAGPDARGDGAGGRRTLAARVVLDARKHGELLMPGILAACADAGIEPAGIDAIVVGAGPGPFTGLRVGMVTAASLGDALRIPVHGVCSLDAIAAAAGPAVDGGTLLVATDARRREVYWATYARDGARLTGPAVGHPDAVAQGLAELGVSAAAGAEAARFGLPVREPAAPTPDGLVAVAAPALRAGVAPGPLEPLYLRRPDAVPPGERKRVSVR